jgi:hypothetical protein
MGLVNLTQKHSFKALNEACAKAHAQGTWRLRDVRTLLQNPGAPSQLNFLEDHPLIRDLSEYGVPSESTAARLRLSCATRNPMAAAYI